MTEIRKNIVSVKYIKVNYYLYRIFINELKYKLKEKEKDIYLSATTFDKNEKQTKEIYWITLHNIKEKLLVIEFKEDDLFSNYYIVTIHPDFKEIILKSISEILEQSVEITEKIEVDYRWIND